MLDPLKRLFGREDPHKKKIYMVQPSILYHTGTERKCKSYLKDYFDAGKIHTPLDFRRKPRSFFKQLIAESDIIVGVIVKDVYTYPVWQDLEYAQSLKKPFFTLRVVKMGIRKVDLFLLEGIVDFEKLTWEETQLLYMEIQKKQAGFPLLFGRPPEY